MTRAARIGTLALLVVAGGSAAAVDAPSPDASPSVQRRAIAAERAAIEQRHAEQERDCVQRFVVTSCLDAAREQRRNALAPLRQEELRIDMLERRQRAAARLEEIEVKQRADVARDAASAAAPAPVPREAPRPAPAAQTPFVVPARPAPVGAAERERREAESTARFDARQAQASRHRAEVEQRNAARAAQGKVARPLPAASSASAL